MYQCSSCGFTMSTPQDNCPSCGIRLSGVKCKTCSYTDSKEVFVRNNNRCPKCGSSVDVGDFPQRRIPYLFLTALFFAIGYYTFTSDNSPNRPSWVCVGVFAIGLICFSAVISPRVARRPLFGGSIAGVFLSLPVNGVLLNNFFDITSPRVYRVTPIVLMIGVGAFLEFKKRAEEGSESSSLTTISFSSAMPPPMSRDTDGNTSTNTESQDRDPS